MNLWLILKISVLNGIQIPWKIMTVEEETGSLSIYSGLLTRKTEVICPLCQQRCRERRAHEIYWNSFKTYSSISRPYALKITQAIFSYVKGVELNQSFPQRHSEVKHNIIFISKIHHALRKYCTFPAKYCISNVTKKKKGVQQE